jgi:threonyl-tRNA synthetase
MLDIRSPLPEDCAELVPIYGDSPEGLELIRHSTAHVMAAAVKKLFPQARVTIGPAIESGFYYDFDVERPFSDEDFPAIEEEMRKLVRASLPFVRETMEKEAAHQRFLAAGEHYKAEIIEAIEGDTVSLYTCGDFTDLCRGPHVPHTGFAVAFKLLSVAGAYWRGDEKNKMLSRIYGTAFADDKALAFWLKQQEEAKRRDHRKLGRELEFFNFQEDVAPGMVFWLPKGMLMRVILEDFWRKEHLRRGYDIVQGPQLLRVETWQKSGHYDHYRENMYFTSIEKDAYGIKPMNCIAHMLIYKNALRSYRDLPQRYFELGVVHRHEKSGVLHGLLRVRQFTQDDAHIICAPEQLEGEILSVIHLIRDLMGLFGFEYKVAISTRPESSIGTDEAWEMATTALIRAVEKSGLPYAVNTGDGAFYGPKIDVRLLDCIGREWQCSTIQVDFTLPERFDLVYTARDGARRRPVMVHRAIMGSLERFIGVLIEHYAGALPVWLVPEQARVLTVTEAGDESAQKLCRELAAAGIRVDVDTRNEKLGFKIREAQMAKMPYMLVVGEKEAQVGGASVRLRSGENMGLKTVGEIADLIRADAEEPFKQGGMRYSFA